MTFLAHIHNNIYSCQFYFESMEEQFYLLCVFDGGDTFV